MQFLDGETLQNGHDFFSRAALMCSPEEISHFFL
jgi:hypothetical protein